MICAIVIVLCSVGIFVIAVAVLVASAFIGRAPVVDGRRLHGMEVVRSGHVSAYLLETGPHEIALVDTGNDADAGAILSALRKRGLGPEAVKAILLTHGDADHIRGAHVFQQAQVMALAPEVDLVEGRAVRGPLRSAKPTGVRVTRVLHDGDELLLGRVHVEVFALPGHTSGSAALLIGGILFLGDSTDTTSGGKLTVGAWIFCADRSQNRKSIRTLASRLAARSNEVKAIACSHSGVLTRGLAPLAELAAALEP